MKKLIFASMIALIVAGIALAESVPFRTTLAVTGGSGVYTIPASQIAKPYGEAAKFLAILTPSAVATTNTIKVVDGTITNTIATKVVAANDCDTALTADWWHFAGEKLIIECSATNAFTAVLIGEEQ